MKDKFSITDKFSLSSSFSAGPQVDWHYLAESPPKPPTKPPVSVSFSQNDANCPLSSEAYLSAP